MVFFYSLEDRGQTAVAQNWIGGRNSTDPEKLVVVLTPEGVYEDIAFGVTKKGRAELRDLHKFLHDAVDGLYVKLVDSHKSDDHGHDRVDFRRDRRRYLQNGKAVFGQGCQRVRGRQRAYFAHLDYYDPAAIMRQVGVLPEQKK